MELNAFSHAIIDNYEQHNHEVHFNYPELMEIDAIRSHIELYGWMNFIKESSEVLKYKAYDEYKGRLNVYIENYHHLPKLIRNLRNTDIGQLVNIDCSVKKITDTRQEVILSAYNCMCGAQIEPVEVISGWNVNKVPYNVMCPAESKHPKSMLYLDPARCVYRDIQYVTIQDSTYEDAKQPRSILLIVSGSMVDKLGVGNRCRVTGVVCSRVEHDGIAVMYLECVNIVREDADISDVVITEEDIPVLKEMSKDPLLLDKLCESINPAIFGYTMIKKSLILQLFGGNYKEYSDGHRDKGDIHILLCGDPSVAKSDLIRSIHNIGLRTIYTSGKSTSGAGLTATAVKDEMDRWTLEAGAMVLADKGMCIIDELDKMDANDRASLLEAMQSQTISFNKAGISETLNTRCSILAAANPKHGKYIQGESLADQVNLSPALFSRFDLIFNIIDTPDKDSDARVADIIMQNRYDLLPSDDNRPISIEHIRKYITYAKQICIVVPEIVREYIRNKYVMYRLHEDSYVTARFIGAMNRLTEASARSRLRTLATVEDAELAIQLYEESMKTVTLISSVKDMYGILSEVEVSMRKSVHRYLMSGDSELESLVHVLCKDYPNEKINRIRDIIDTLYRDNQIEYHERTDGKRYVRWKINHPDS